MSNPPVPLLGAPARALLSSVSRRKRLLGTLVVGGCSALGLAACSPTPANLGHGPLGISQATRAAGAVITIYNSSIVPPITRVPVGTNVLVINTSGDSHSITAFDGSFNTPVLAGGGDDASFIVTKPGTFRYYDVLNTFLQGEIIVTPATS